MNNRVKGASLLLAGMLATGQAFAEYWFASDKVVRTSTGECVRTGYWTPEAIIVGCDGKAATKPAPVPVAETAVPLAPPPVAPPVKSAESTVNFGFDRADLDQSARAVVDGLLGEVSGEIRSVRVTGHADRIGTEEYNLDLSLRRASAVSDYLSGRAAVDADKIEIAGKGESAPLVSCEGIYGAAAIRCLAPNRRVDVIIDTF